ncbi:MAG TPA: DMT family transporter [Terriglobales bacterium]|nr:DMT family transporter [Terriglobales bacterium]
MPPGAALPRDPSGLAEVHLSVLLFGFAALFGKWLPLAPEAIVFGRAAFAALAIGLAAAAGHRPLRVALPRDRLLLILCGLVLAAHWTMFFRSVQASTVAVALLSYSSFPVFTAFLEPWLLRERWDPSSLALAFLTVAGVFLIVPGRDLRSPEGLGVAWGLGSGLTFSLLSLVNRRLASRLPSPTVAFHQDLWAALFLLPLVVLRPPAVTARDMGLLAVLGVFGTAGAHTLFIEGLKRIRARAASIISSLEPVYGIALAALFLKESPSLRTVSGGALILAAALAVTMRAGRPPSS